MDSPKHPLAADDYFNQLEMDNETAQGDTPILIAPDRTWCPREITVGRQIAPRTEDILVMVHYAPGPGLGTLSAAAIARACRVAVDRARRATAPDTHQWGEAHMNSPAVATNKPSLSGIQSGQIAEVAKAYPKPQAPDRGDAHEATIKVQIEYAPGSDAILAERVAEHLHDDSIDPAPQAPTHHSPQYVTKDSGERSQFSTGAHRDCSSGKGRYDLLPPEAIRRVAQLYERGALKYSDRNWELGMPISRMVDSMLRHAFQVSQGMDDEDHAAAVIFNAAGIITIRERIAAGLLPPELDDMPRWIPKDF